MNNQKYVVEAINVRHGYFADSRRLLLLYNDGTYEYIFEYERGIDVINHRTFDNKTREQVITRLEEDYYNDRIKGKFLDV